MPDWASARQVYESRLRGGLTKISPDAGIPWRREGSPVRSATAKASVSIPTASAQMRTASLRLAALSNARQSRGPHRYRPNPCLICLQVGMRCQKGVTFTDKPFFSAFRRTQSPPRCRRDIWCPTTEVAQPVVGTGGHGQSAVVGTFIGLEIFNDVRAYVY